MAVTSQGSWELSSDNKKLSYKVEDTVVAELAGFNASAVTVTEGKVTGITVADDGTISVSDSLLGTSTATPLKLTNSEGETYTLALADDSDGDGKTGFTSGNYWTATKKDGKVTAKYNQGTTEGHTLADDKLSISYTAAPTPTVLATITGLNGNVVVDASDKSIIGIADSEGKVAAGITVKSSLIKVSSSVLGTAPVELKSTANYELDIDNTVPTKSTKANVFGVNNGSVVYKEVDTAYYTQSGNKLTYTAQKNVTGGTIATISGVKTTADALAALTVDPKTKTITVGAAALNDKSITIKAGTDTYTLKLAEGIDAPVISNQTVNATSNTTTATIKGDVVAGYEDSADGSKILYTGKGTQKALATISGIKKVTAANKSEIEAAITIGEDGKTITIGKDALGTSAKTPVTISNESYTLALDEEVPQDSTQFEGWNFKDGTATYGKITPAYYAVEDGKLVYHAEQMTDVIAKLTGLKKGLKVDTEEDEDGNTKSVIKDGESTVISLSGTKITITGDALTTQSVAFDSNLRNYTLALEGAEDLKPALAGTLNATWAVSGTTTKTVTYKGDVTAGWELSNDKQAINYSKAQTKAGKNQATLMTITGLSKAVTAANANTAIEADDNECVLTLTAKALTGSDITAKSDYGYTIALDESDDDVKTEAETGNKWDIEGSTAYYNEVTSAYYTKSGNNAITYNAPVTKELARLTDINSELEKNDEEDALVDSEGETAISADGNKIKLTKSALAGETIKLGTNYAYVLDMTKGTDYTEPAPAFTLGFSGTTATLYSGTSEGYKLATSNKALVYSEADTGSAIATVAGLKSGLTVGKIKDANDNLVPAIGTGVYSEDESKNTFTAGLTFDSSAKTITLNRNVLGTTNVNFGINTQGYKFLLDDVPIEPDASTTTIWKIDGTTAYLNDYTPEYWKPDSTKKITKLTHVGENNEGANHLVISGLKTNLKTGTTIEGLTYDAETKTVTVGSKVLAANDVELTSKDGVTYTLALGDDVAQKSVVDYVWTYNSSKKTASYVQKIGKGYSVDTDKQSILYSKKGEENTLVTISGVTGKEGLSISADGVITVPDSLLTNKSVTFTKNNGNYTLKLADDTEKKPSETSVGEWSKANKNGVATLGGNVTEGYEVSGDGLSIDYTAASTKELATLKGLKKNLKAEKVNAGITVLNNQVVLQTPDILANSAVSLSSNNGFTLALKSAEDFATKALTADLRVESGTATIVKGTSRGWSISGNSLSLTKEKVTTLATIKGLNAEAEAGTDVTLDTTTNVITLNNAALNSKKVTLETSGTYQLAFGSDVTELSTAEEPHWTGSGNNVTLKDFASKGYALAADNKSINYYSKSTATDTLAVLKGLNTKLTVDKTTGKIDGVNVRTDSNKIALAPTALGTTKVTLTSDTYTLDASALVAPQYSDALWSGSKGTATLKQSNTEGWTLDEEGKTLTRTAKADNKVLATISGLNKKYDFTTSGSEVLSYDKDSKTVTVKQDALGTTKVTTSTKGITLALDGDVAQKAETATEWVTTGTTATYKKYARAYYELNDKGAIVYHKPVDSKVYAEVKGIKSGVDISDCVKGGVITLADDQLGTSKVTLTGDGYTLALDDYFTSRVSQADATWGKADNKGTATLKGNLTKGYELSDDKKIITYTAPKNNQVFATVTGLKSGVDLGEDGYIKNNVITLTEDDLNAKNVTLTNKNGSAYTLKLDGVDPASFTAGDWSIKSGSATLTGDITAGYELTSDTTIAYTAGGNGKTIATINGLNASVTAENFAVPEDKTISLEKDQLKGAVTVGGGWYNFEFDGDYSNASITGSKANDTITVKGKGLTVTGGAGNDVIDMGTAGGNTFFYAKGHGDDVIADFTGGSSSNADTIKIKDVAITKSNISTNGNDVVIKVGSGSITLEDVAGQTIGLIDKSGSKSYYNTSSADLLEEDNFLTGGAQLDEITNTAFNAYSLDDVDTTAQSLKTLTKQSTLVAYGSDKK